MASSETDLLLKEEYKIWYDKELAEQQSQARKDSDTSNNNSVPYHVYTRRWYILFQFSLLCFLQTASAGLWSPISLSAEKAIGFSAGELDLLSDWSAIGVLISLPVSMWFLNKYGLRWAILSGSLCLLLGTGLCCLPLGANQKYAIHVGQFLKGVANSPIMGCAPSISNTWFPVKERVLATGLMTMSGATGSVVSFLFGPYFVQQPSNFSSANITGNASTTTKMRHEIETYLLIEFGISVASFMMMLLYFPNKPPTPPSPSAAGGRLNFKLGIKALLRKKTYWSVMAVTCGTVGGYMGFRAVMPIVYEAKDISQKTIGLMGTVSSASGVAVGLFFSWAADRLKTKRSFIWILCNTIIYITCVYVVVMSMNWIPMQPFKFSETAVWISTTILGLLIYALQPLGLEMMADSAYPVDEGTAIYVFSSLAILTNVILFSVVGALKDQNTMFYIMLAFMTLAPPFLYQSIQHSDARLQLDVGGV